MVEAKEVALETTNEVILNETEILNETYTSKKICSVIKIVPQQCDQNRNSRKEANIDHTNKVIFQQRDQDRNSRKVGNTEYTSKVVSQQCDQTRIARKLDRIKSINKVVLHQCDQGRNSRRVGSTDKDGKSKVDSPENTTKVFLTKRSEHELHTEVDIKEEARELHNDNDAICENSSLFIDCGKSALSQMKEDTDGDAKSEIKEELSVDAVNQSMDPLFVPGVFI